MLLCLSLNAQHAPLEVRESFAFQPQELPEISAYLRPHVAETLLISTCQRFEAYVIARGNMEGQCLAGLMARDRQVDLGRVDRHAMVYRDRDAAEHLFRVATGLESPVLGEAEIMGQVRRALEAARNAGLAGQRLGNLAQHALSAAGRVREETALSRGALSVPRVAVDRARLEMGDIASGTVLLVGAGETASLAAKALGPVGRLLVVNRTLAHAMTLAAEYGGEALPWTDLTDAVAAADLVFCCTGPHRPPLSRRLVAAAQCKRGDTPLLLVDLAVPRGIDRAAAEVAGVRLITVDDLHEETSARQAERLRAVPDAERILAHEVERAWRAYEGAAAQSAVSALRQRAEEIRQAELERVLSRIQSLPAEHGEALDYLTRAIVNKLLHQPTVWLKTNPDLADGALRDVFGVGTGAHA